ncbi:hypothetical protein CRENBAI_003310, partial [Crenichthys baileyi]
SGNPDPGPRRAVSNPRWATPPPTLPQGENPPPASRRGPPNARSKGPHPHPKRDPQHPGQPKQKQ